MIDIDVDVCQRNPNLTATCRDFPTSIITLHSPLRRPGTGYISGGSRRVYYVPRPGDQLASMPSVYVPSFSGPLLSIKGERHGHANGNADLPPRFVENVEFTGLTLQHASWSHSSSCGYLADQGGQVYDCDMSFCCTSGLLGRVYPVGSAWEVKTARNVHITNVVIRNVGGGGIAVDEGSDGVTLADYVMPWFLFMVGTSLAISMRKYDRRDARLDGTRATLARAVRRPEVDELPLANLAEAHEVLGLHGAVHPPRRVHRRHHLEHALPDRR